MEGSVDYRKLKDAITWPLVLTNKIHYDRIG